MTACSEIKTKSMKLILCQNPVECEKEQKKLFKLGYKWFNQEEPIFKSLHQKDYPIFIMVMEENETKPKIGYGKFDSNVLLWCDVTYAKEHFKQEFRKVALKYLKEKND